MLDLTPSERRGALVLLALVLLGAFADLVQLRPSAAPPPPDPPAVTAPGGPRDAVAPPAAARLDLNAASEADLDRLPGIGPVLAARIVAHREAHGPLRRTDELLAVPGIGPRLFSRLEPLVVAGARRDSSARAVQNARGRAH